MWHRMRGDLPREEGNDATRRGQYLEDGILAWWRDKHDVQDDREWSDQPSYTLGAWAAATPDAACCHPVDDTVLVEAKSTAQDWGDELPAHYLTQVIWQMHVSGIHRCYVPVLGPRLTFTEYVVDYADYAQDAVLIEQKAREFYDSLSGDTPPDLDDTVATYEAVRKAHPDIDRGETVELTREQADDLVTFAHLAKETERSLRLAKSTVLDVMANAQYATCEGVRIARRQPRGDQVSFVVVGKPGDLAKQKESA